MKTRHKTTKKLNRGMVKWEYLTMVVNSDGEEKTVMILNGQDAAVGKDYFGKEYASFYERIYAAGQEGWELAGIEYRADRRGATYVFKRLVSRELEIREGCFTLNVLF